METKHTAGPWRYWLQRRHPEDTCTFQNTKGQEVLRAVTVTVTEADARLIAAAPDMLETLMALDNMGGLGLTTHKLIERAITKATGETK